jgi:uncharacterized protein
VCNLDCTYCYYLHKEDLLGNQAGSRISDEVLEEFVRQYITGQEVESVTFNWHGGEPALLGLDFFRKVVELERKYANGKRIENDFQTNGVLLDDAWCEFFKEHRFYVGLSIDGSKHLHDQFRSGFDQVYRAARLLQKHEVPFNPLTVINRITAKHPVEVYKFLTEDLGCTRLQWLPCVGHKDFQRVAPRYWTADRIPAIGTPGAKPGNGLVTDWSVDPDDWGEFLCQTFDLWYKTGLGKVCVNWFESFVGQWMGKPAQICTLAPVCGRSLLTLEQDGSLYSCDHFVYPEYRLGNLGDEDFNLAEAAYSAAQRQFGMNKRESLPDYCKQCKYNFACNGECPKNRFLKTPDGQPGLNYLCSGIKRFLTYADPTLRQIAARVDQTRRAVGNIKPPERTRDA